MKISKLFSLILVIFLVTSISGCLTVPILKVTTTIGGTTDAPVIESIEVEQGTVDALKRPKDYPPHAPGVYVWVLKGTDPRITQDPERTSSPPASGMEKSPSQAIHCACGFRFSMNPAVTLRIMRPRWFGNDWFLRSVKPILSRRNC